MKHENMSNLKILTRNYCLIISLFTISWPLIADKYFWLWPKLIHLVKPIRKFKGTILAPPPPWHNKIFRFQSWMRLSKSYWLWFSFWHLFFIFQSPLILVSLNCRIWTHTIKNQSDQMPHFTRSWCIPFMYVNNHYHFI